MQEAERTGPWRKVVLDSETDGIYPTKVHCIVCKDLDTKEVFKFVEGQCYSEFLEFFTKQVLKIVGHNLIDYDIPKVLNNLLGLEIDLNNVEDTFVFSRLAYSDRYQRDIQKWGSEEKIPRHYKQTLKGKPHSLGAWGIRVGRYKPEYDDWSTYTPEMLHRCTEDVEINEIVYYKLLEELKPFSNFSIRLEHRTAEIISEQIRNGFKLDGKVAQELYEVCQTKADELRKEIQSEIPPHVVKLGDREKGYYVEPRIKEVKVFTGEYEEKEYVSANGRKSVRKVKVYEIHRTISSSTAKYDYVTYGGTIPIRGPFSPVSFEPFNPDSPPQRLEVLNRSGWEPINFNEPTEVMLSKGITRGNPKTTDEENLDTIPDDAPQGIKNLGRYIMHQNRATLAKTWLELAQGSKDGRVRGYVDSCGTPTGRMRHSSPNLANVVSVDPVDKFEEKDLQELISFKLEHFERVPKGKYTGHVWAGTVDKPKVILTGEEGKYGFECRSCWISDTGLTMVGCDAAGLELRMLAHYMNDEEYTYELLNGDIHSKNQNLAGLPSRNTAKTFIYGFLYGAGDAKIGRIVNGSKNHGAKLKSTFLQGLPSLSNLINNIKSQARKGWLRGLDGRILWVRYEHAALNTLLQSAGAIVMKVALCLAYKEWKAKGITFKLLANVHDEIVAEVEPSRAEEFAKIFVDKIKEAGVVLKMNCPLDGSMNFGKSWSEVH